MKLVKISQYIFDITLWIAAFVVLLRSVGDWDMMILTILGISAYAEARLGRLK